MPIDPEFMQKLPKTGQHEGHEVYGEGVPRTLELGGKTFVGTQGIHGTIAAVDFDLCIADGVCLEVCPVDVFDWFKDKTKPKKTLGLKAEMDIDPLTSDHSDPTREKDCIFCMACEIQCPTQCIKIFQA